MIINGVTTDTLTANDRAIQYGDGCFSTMKVSATGEIELIAKHISRLQRDCQRLSIIFDGWDRLRLAMRQQALAKPDSVLKVLISRGQGGRGYGISGVTNPSWLISSHKLPSHYSSWKESGIRLMLSSVRLARQPLLAGVKHLNRLEQVLAKADLEQSDYDDALLCDCEGKLVEATAANLFWCEGEQWFTPSLTHSGVAGVMRQHIFEFLAASGQQVQQVSVKPQRLNKATDMFLSNCLMGVMPVAALFLPTHNEPVTFVNNNTIKLMEQLV